MRADHDVDESAGDPREHVRAARPGSEVHLGHVGGEQSHPHGAVSMVRSLGSEQAHRAAGTAGSLRLRSEAGILERRNRAQVVLDGENLGWRHDRSLMAPLDCGQQGRQRHHGLARSHLSLKQPMHRCRSDEILLDLIDRLPLGAGELKGKPGQKRPDQGSITTVRHSARRRDLLLLAQGQRKLEAEELVEDEPLPSPLRVCFRFGEVHISDGSIARYESVPCHDVLGNGLGNGPGTAQGVVDGCAHFPGPRRATLGCIGTILAMRRESSLPSVARSGLFI